MPTDRSHNLGSFCIGLTGLYDRYLELLSFDPHSLRGYASSEQNVSIMEDVEELMEFSSETDFAPLPQQIEHMAAMELPVHIWQHGWRMGRLASTGEVVKLKKGFKAVYRCNSSVVLNILDAVRGDAAFFWFDTNLVLFKTHLWEMTPAELSLAPEDLAAVLIEADQRLDFLDHFGQKQSLTQHSNTNASSDNSRSVSKTVQREVWQRDQGQCVQCSSKERLEYDHISPVSKGGSNTARNIQLLCETCNRSKGASIGG